MANQKIIPILLGILVLSVLPFTFDSAFALPPDPPKQFFADLDFVMTWLAGELNGDTHTSYEVEYYDEDSATWIELTSQAGVDYTDSTPINDETVKLRIQDTGGSGVGCTTPALNSTLSNNLVAHWNLCNTLNDNGILDNDLEVGGASTVWNTTGTIPALDFEEGVLDKWFEAPNETDYDFMDESANFTWSFWYKLTTDDATNHIPLGKANAASQPGAHLFLSANEQPFFSMSATSTSDECRTPMSVVIDDSLWHHYVIAVNDVLSDCDAGIEMWQDNVSVETAPNVNTLTGSVTNNYNFTVGSGNAGNTKAHGEIRDIMIFNVTLDDHQVDQLYNEYIDHNAEPEAPSIVAYEVNDSALGWNTTANDPGSQTPTDYSVRCDTNGGGWVTTVTSDPIPSPRQHIITGVYTTDVIICQWRDESSAGVGDWSANATASVLIDVIQSARSDTEDKLKEFENFLDDNGGVFFGMSLFPFITMIIAFMAGKKTVRIFTLLTLMLMGVFHASGYFVYPDWYWALSMLLGLGLVLGRQRSD